MYIGSQSALTVLVAAVRCAADVELRIQPDRDEPTVTFREVAAAVAEVQATSETPSGSPRNLWVATARRAMDEARHTPPGRMAADGGPPGAPTRT